MKEVVLIFSLTLNRIRSEDSRKSVVHLPFGLLHFDVFDVDRKRRQGKERSDEIGSVTDDGVVEDVGETTRILTDYISE